MSVRPPEKKPFKDVIIFDAFVYLNVIYMKMTATHAQHYRTGESFDFSTLLDKVVAIVPPTENPHIWLMELPPEDEVVPDDTLLPGEKE